MGIKTRPLLGIITKSLSGDANLKLAHEKLLAVEQRHKQLVQEVGINNKKNGEVTTKTTHEEMCTVLMISLEIKTTKIHRLLTVLVY